MKNTLRLLLAGLTLLMILTIEPVIADQSAVPAVTRAWARATLPGSRNGAIYLTIENVTEHDVVLLDAESDRAGSTTLHETRLVNDMMRMRGIKQLQLPRQSVTVLKPRGLHFMLKQLTQPLSNGDELALKLRFEIPGRPVATIETVVQVGPTSAMDYPE